MSEALVGGLFSANNCKTGNQFSLVRSLNERFGTISPSVYSFINLALLPYCLFLLASLSPFFPLSLSLYLSLCPYYPLTLSLYIFILTNVEKV